MKDMSEDTLHGQISNRAHRLTIGAKELSRTAETPAGCHCLGRAWTNVTCCELEGSNILLLYFLRLHGESWWTGTAGHSMDHDPGGRSALAC